MNPFEEKIIVFLSEKADFPGNLLKLLENLSVTEEISINSQIQDELRNRLKATIMEEEIWDTLLPILPPNELSEDLLKYLITNNIATVTLAHLQLPDKWLLKLAIYDDAPLYTLAKRYYLSKEYTSLDFLHFYKQHLQSKSDIVLYLLDAYPKAEKRSLLIFTCTNDRHFEKQEAVQWHQEADRVQGLTASNELSSVYQKHPNNGIILKQMAANYFTPDEILLELTAIKGIPYASEIRKISSNTLTVKRVVY